VDMYIYVCTFACMHISTAGAAGLGRGGCVYIYEMDICGYVYVDTNVYLYIYGCMCISTDGAEGIYRWMYVCIYLLLALEAGGAKGGFIYIVYIYGGMFIYII